MGQQLQSDQFTSPNNQRRIRYALVDWLSKEDWSHAITLSINRQVPVAIATSMYSLFCREMDMYKFGTKNVRTLPSADRFSAVATIEHPDSNIHIHVAANLGSWLPKPVSDIDLHEFHKMWGRCTRGSGDVEFVDAYDVPGWLFYMTKEFYKRPMDLMFASDFHPN